MDKKAAAVDLITLIHKHCKTDEDINYIAKLALVSAMNKDVVRPDPEPTPLYTTFLKIKDQHFHCECGSILFSKMTDESYHCNNCPRMYEGEN